MKNAVENAVAALMLALIVGVFVAPGLAVHFWPERAHVLTVRVDRAGCP